VDPSPPISAASAEIVKAKARLRREHRRLRREHVTGLPDSIRALLFLRPPGAIVQAIPAGVAVGLYHPHAHEAPTRSYARWLHENGHGIALPRFAARDAPMTFATWADPYDEDALEIGPFGMLQPRANAALVTPAVLFVPLIAFTADGARLGQGGGHYDRWLEAHPDTLTMGLAWDSQLAETLPREAHDRTLAMIVTPTRLYEGAR